MTTIVELNYRILNWRRKVIGVYFAWFCFQFLRYTAGYMLLMLGAYVGYCTECKNLNYYILYWGSWHGFIMAVASSMGTASMCIFFQCTTARNCFQAGLALIGVLLWSTIDSAITLVIYKLKNPLSGALVPEEVKFIYTLNIVDNALNPTLLIVFLLIFGPVIKQCYRDMQQQTAYPSLLSG